MLVHLFVGLDDVLKLDGGRGPLSLVLDNFHRRIGGVDLAHAVDGAHDELVQVASDEQVGFEAKRHEQGCSR